MWVVVGIVVAVLLIRGGSVVALAQPLAYPDCDLVICLAPNE